MTGDASLRWSLGPAASIGAVAMVAAALLIVHAESPPPIPPSAEFAVGVLRVDGALIPVATYRHRRWDVTWPSNDIGNLDIPISLASIPRDWWGPLGPRETWQVFADGHPGAIVRPRSPVVVAAQCRSRMAIMTDYRRAVAPPPAGVQPYPKVGIALSPMVAVEPIEILTSASPEWNAIGSALKEQFDDGEDLLAVMWTREGDPHPIPPKERKGTPLTIDAMYASGEGAARVYFVEAGRTYDHSDDKPAICAAAFGGAFFQRDKDGFRGLGSDVRVVPCDRRGLVYMLPFGAFRIGEKIFWIVQFSGWDSEIYQVIEFKRPKIQVVASSFAGGC